MWCCQARWSRLPVVCWNFLARGLGMKCTFLVRTYDYYRFLLVCFKKQRYFWEECKETLWPDWWTMNLASIAIHSSICRASEGHPDYFRFRRMHEVPMWVVLMVLNGSSPEIFGLFELIFYMPQFVGDVPISIGCYRDSLSGTWFLHVPNADKEILGMPTSWNYGDEIR